MAALIMSGVRACRGHIYLIGFIGSILLHGGVKEREVL